MRATGGLAPVLALCTIGCGGSYSAPAPSINLAGTWSGLVGLPMSGSALRLTWQATQNAATASGSATLLKPAVNVPANGTLSGTLSGDRLTLTYSAPAGSVPGFGACSVAGAGSATVTGTTISGTLDLTFTSCAGTGLDPTGSNQLSLTRQ